MNVVFDLADQVSVLVRGELVVSDTPQRVRDNALVRETYLGSAAVTRIAREQ
jgi:branched-chain amino acid transport system ATP-binding protein